MAYQTGSATSPADLVAIIKAFSVGQGWTVDGDVIYKGSIFAKVFVTGNDINITGGTGQSAGALSGECPGVGRIYDGSAETDKWGDLNNNWPLNYWLFGHTNPDMVFCVINYNGTFHQWLTFGTITKYGDWVGGEYYAASHADSIYIQAVGMGYYSSKDYDSSGDLGHLFMSSSLAPFWNGGATWSDTGEYTRPDGTYLHCEIDGAVWGSGTMKDTGFSDSFIHIRHSTAMGGLLKNALNQWNSQTVLLPYYLFAKRVGDKYSQLGVIADIRSCRIDNYNPGDIITIGADKWMVFPWVKKATLGTDYSSGGMGVAIKYDGP